MRAHRRPISVGLGLLTLALISGCTSRPDESLDRSRLDFGQRFIATASTSSRFKAQGSSGNLRDRNPVELDGLRAYRADLALAQGLRKPQPTVLSSAEAHDLDALLHLAWKQHPQLLAKKRGLHASYARYQQTDWLGDLVRSVESTLRLGRSGGGPPSAALRLEGALGPWPAVETLRGQIADQDVRVAYERLRMAVIERRAEILERLGKLEAAEARRTLAKRHATLMNDIAEILHPRLKSGASLQAEILATEARFADLIRLVGDLELKRTDAESALKEALGFAANAPLPSLVGSPTKKPQWSDAKNDPRTEIARARVDRIRAGLRLAETVVRVRSDVATARFERRLSAEGGVGRKKSLSRIGPRPHPRATAIGPALALIEEARRRLFAAEAEVEATRLKVKRQRESARTAVATSALELTALREEILPRIKAAYDSQLMSLGRGNAGYLDVIKIAQQLINTEDREVLARRALAIALARATVANGRPLPTP
ncbi:MAG: hypothetical protein V3W41_15480 [Planctomycetota bacterium]